MHANLPIRVRPTYKINKFSPIIKKTRFLLWKKILPACSLGSRCRSTHQTRSSETQQKKQKQKRGRVHLSSFSSALISLFFENQLSTLIFCHVSIVPFKLFRHHNTTPRAGEKKKTIGLAKKRQQQHEAGDPTPVERTKNHNVYFAAPVISSW
jgi:hypothetical protein